VRPEAASVTNCLSSPVGYPKYCGVWLGTAGLLQLELSGQFWACKCLVYIYCICIQRWCSRWLKEFFGFVSMAGAGIDLFLYYYI